ncbi:DUF6385 domain-containing protein [Peribacillus alkalitolerans]|uniref:DUF6385 domain-containing protein n=1 Tax=Peribacillus alkalitolerans TaxID=1550385 RepID=UPI0013D8DDD6|nr:DUF6385 domain-containing protein [Peribacillus alkalitolerans]
MIEDRLTEVTSPIDPSSFVIKEESIFGEDIPNQWSFKVRKIESVVFNPPNLEKPVQQDSREWVKDNEEHFINIKKSLIIKNDGKAFITFDVSHFKRYSIYVINQKTYGSIQFLVELSPDNVHFIKKFAINDLQMGDTDYITICDLSRFVRVRIHGRAGKEVFVYLQAEK